MHVNHRQPITICILPYEVRSKKMVVRSLYRTKHHSNHLKIPYQIDNGQSHVTNMWVTYSKGPLQIRHKTTSGSTSTLR